MNSPMSTSPIDRERHKPPGQHLKGPISAPAPLFSRPTSPPLAVIRSTSSSLHSSL
uniref:Phosphatase 2C family protein n=1 Tax=Rhizophora mucronata TaxID=61149 RepID=A0A2P2IIV2_RHIMU